MIDSIYANSDLYHHYIYYILFSYKQNSQMIEEKYTAGDLNQDEVIQTCVDIVIHSTPRPKWEIQRKKLITKIIYQ